MQASICNYPVLAPASYAHHRDFLPLLSGINILFALYERSRALQACELCSSRRSVYLMVMAQT